MKLSRIVLLVVALWFSAGLKPGLAAPDEYDDSQSHPLRILAYLVYPAAFLVEWTVFRPFHYLVSATEPQEALFGHTPHPPVIAGPQPIHDYGVAPKTSADEKQSGIESQAAPKSTAGNGPIGETVRIVKVPVEKTVVKEVPKIVEIPTVVFPSVAFRFDSAELTELGKGQLYLAAQRLKENADLTIAVEGHTDGIGNQAYNQKLGLRRAKKVMEELVALGVDPGRVSTLSLGEAKPLVGQETQWARAVNRRVEFQVKAAR